MFHFLVPSLGARAVSIRAPVICSESKQVVVVVVFVVVVVVVGANVSRLACQLE